MIFRQLFDSISSTYTYIIGCEQTREAIIVDPVLEHVERDHKLLNELELKLKLTLETHIHADHITGAANLRELTGCQISIPNDPNVKGADLTLHDGDTLDIGEVNIEILGLAGHTGYDFCYLIDDKLLLTGDMLFIRGCGRTDFQAGDAGTLYDNIKLRIFSLDDSILIYPGHDYKGCLLSTVGEEKRYNPRLASTTREDFIEIMGNLNLPKPKQINIAVPRNLQCGENL